MEFCGPIVHHDDATTPDREPSTDKPDTVAPPQGVKDKIPPSWGDGKPSKGGTKWADPKNPKGNNVRWQPGNPKSPNPRQQQPYVKVQKGGKTIGENGQPIDPNANGGRPSATPEAHIPENKFCILGICF